MLVAFLAWAALICAGLGGTVGVVSQMLAGKLAASAQHLQRQAGNSASSRALRRELPVAASQLRGAEAAAAVTAPHTGGVAPAGGIAIPQVPPQSEVRAFHAAQPRPAVRHRSPPSRAPPFLA
jgi:hypothetical protein